MMVSLKELKPFAQGGNRLCFVHPHDSTRCIKVRRPDFTLADCRRKKGFPKNLRPLSSFDDNREECRVIVQLQQQLGGIAFEHVYRCYGFIQTDLGMGLNTEMIRDGNGMVSLSLKQYIWEEGYDEQCRQAVVALADFWRRHQVPSRDLLTHNVVVQRDLNDAIIRLVVIDGLGSPSLIPFGCLPQYLKKKHVATRIKRLDQRITEFIGNCAAGKPPSRIGMLLHRDVAAFHSQDRVATTPDRDEM